MLRAHRSDAPPGESRSELGTKKTYPASGPATPAPTEIAAAAQARRERLRVAIDRLDAVACARPAEARGAQGAVPAWVDVLTLRAFLHVLIGYDVRGAGEAYPAIDTIARRICRSRRTAIRVATAAALLGFVRRLPPGMYGLERRKSTTYRIDGERIAQAVAAVTASPAAAPAAAPAPAPGASPDESTIARLERELASARAEIARGKSAPASTPATARAELAPASADVARILACLARMPALADLATPRIAAHLATRAAAGAQPIARVERAIAECARDATAADLAGAPWTPGWRASKVERYVIAARAEPGELAAAAASASTRAALAEALRPEPERDAAAERAASVARRRALAVVARIGRAPPVSGGL